MLLTCISSCSKSLNYSVRVAYVTILSSRSYHITGFSFLFPDSARGGGLPQMKWLIRADNSEEPAASTSSLQMQVAGSSETSFIYRITQPNIPDGRENLK